MSGFGKVGREREIEKMQGGKNSSSFVCVHPGKEEEAQCCSK